MSEFYTRLAATALALLAKYGQDVTLVRLTQGAYDPATSTQAKTETLLTFKGAIFDWDDEGDTEGDRDLIVSSDKKLLLEPAAAPTAEDKMLVGGVRYNIVALKTLAPAGTPVLYQLRLSS